MCHTGRVIFGSTLCSGCVRVGLRPLGSGLSRIHVISDRSGARLMAQIGIGSIKLS